MDPDDQESIRTYVVNPIMTVFHDDKYYLVCYTDKHMNLTQFRIDRMEKVQMLDESITPNPNINPQDIVKHKRSLFDMYGGERTTVEFVANISVLDAVYDRFGDNVKVTSCGGDRVYCTVDVQVGRPLISWFIGFGDKLKVKVPISVKQKIVELLKESTVNYIE